MIATRRTERVTSFVCPGCGGPLDYLSADVLWCAGDRTSYRKVDGIWQLLTPERSAYFDRFVADYNRIRRLEGRDSLDARYFRSLPFADTTGQFRSDWKIRSASFTCFLERVVGPLEGHRADLPGRRLRVLDLGAGNGWLSNRLALRGHEVVALELRTSANDGLGACVHYESRFTCVRAEFDHLPFPDGAFDLAVFNASLHYSENFERTLAEALRVVKPDGRICILDSPIYRDPSSGEEMVRRRTADFQSAYGIASDSLVAEEFLTERRLTQLSARIGLTWEMEKPCYGIGWSIRRSVSRVRNRREPARFAVITGRQRVSAEEAVVRMRPGAFGTPIGRAGLRMRYLAAQRHRLRRSDITQFREIRLRIPPGVFHPIIFRTGAFLADQLLLDILPSGVRVLDLGTGTGICAIAAALRGSDVTAVDINPEAVACSSENAAHNGVDLHCRRANLFEGAGTFDVVLFNPPYFAGRPKTSFDLAWRSEDVVERFSAELPRHLSPSGFALIVLSSDGQCASYLRRFERDGYRITRVAERRYLNETLTVFRIR